MKPYILAAAAALAVPALTAAADPAPWGAGFAGWSFTREVLANGDIDCRATLAGAGGPRVLGFVTTPEVRGQGYVGAGGQMTGGLDVNAMEQIADAHGYAGADGSRIELGARAGDALDQLWACSGR